MAQYWLPLAGDQAPTAPSLVNYRRGVGTDGASQHGSSGGENPTVIPEELLQKFHFTFLIRHPRSSIPSYYRCTIPPLSEMTGFHYFDPREAGYKELRLLFDFLVKSGQIGPRIAGKGDRSHKLDASNVVNEQVEICVIDADDLLDNPNGIVEAFCKSVGIKYSSMMLKWDDEETQRHARQTFEKWKGFHEDAIESKELRPRTHVCVEHPGLSIR